MKNPLPAEIIEYNVETTVCNNNLQPLRVAHGWTIEWNTLREIDPSKENVEAFLFTSSSLFTAVNHLKRLLVDVAWLPPDEPDGRFVVEVYHAPIAIGVKHKMISTEEVNYYRDGHLVSTFETLTRVELVVYLEGILSL